jgi:transcription-repair coupling factor (superfamily II helicase)
VPEVRLLPGREFPMDDDARGRFRSRWRELLEGDPTKSRIYKDMGNGVATAGIEYYLPLFFEETATVFDYLGADATVVLHGDLEPAFQHFWQDTNERYRLVQGDPERPALPPEALFLGAEQFYQRAKPYAQLAIRRRAHRGALRRVRQAAALRRGARRRRPAGRPEGHIQSTPHRVLLIAESDGRRESLLDFLRASGVSPPAFDSLAEFEASADEKIGIATAALASGFAWREQGIDLVTETELFATAPTTRRRNKKQEQVSDVEALIKDLSELNVGDPVVHSAHGIGRYRGLIHMDLGQGVDADGKPLLQEMLHLEYADKATLYVPVSQLHQISRYTGVSADEAPLHKLGSGQWEKPSARPPNRCATRPPSCSTSMRAAPRAKAMPFATRRPTTRCSATTSASRKRPTRRPPSTPSCRT